jgi:hypothetical protein
VLVGKRHVRACKPRDRRRKEARPEVIEPALFIAFFAGELLVDAELPVVGCEGVPVVDELAVGRRVVDLLAEGEEVAARDDPRQTCLSVLRFW